MLLCCEGAGAAAGAAQEQGAPAPGDKWEMPRSSPVEQHWSCLFCVLREAAVRGINPILC